MVIATADSEAPFVVVVRVNTHCSLGCLYCGFSRDVHRPRTAIQPQAFLRFAEALSDFQLRRCRTVMVSLLGGEPFQWSDWESVALRLVQLGLKVSATMADWGVDQLTFNQLGGNDRPSFYPHNRLLETQARTFRNAFPRWKSDLRIRGLDLRGSDGYLHRIECTSRNEAIAIDDCSPAEGFLFVDELGRASPCSFTSDSLGVDIDTLTNATAIFSLTNHWRRQRKQSHPKACDDCHATHVHAKFVQLGSMP